MSLLLSLLWACGGEPAATSPVTPEPEAEPAAEAPEPVAVTTVPAVDFALPTKEQRTPHVSQHADELRRVRGILEPVVRTWGLDKDNPWALGHALVALGKGTTFEDGTDVVDHLFTAWADEVQVGEETLIHFPASRGEIRIEPHTDLLLKVLVDIGEDPSRTVTVDGNPHTIGELYRASLAELWIDGSSVSAGVWNDTPWSVRGITGWAPPGLAWTSHGHAQTIDGLAHALIKKADQETRFIAVAMTERKPVQKRRQGIFSYTCGGAHLLQTVGLVAARGFGEDGDGPAVAHQVPRLTYRYGHELGQLDQLLRSKPEYGPILLVQRLKFLGHAVETWHTYAASGVATMTPADLEAMAHAENELVRTVDTLQRTQMLDKLDELRKNPDPNSYQMYLDLIGDSAHAIDAIDLATGDKPVRF